MSVNDQNIKVKEHFFIDKLAEYIKKGNKNSKLSYISDKYIKNHRVLLTPFQLKEIKSLINQAKLGKLEESKKKVKEINISPDNSIDYFNDKLVKKLLYNHDTNSFSLTESMVEILTPPKHSFQMIGIGDVNKHYPKITDKGLKSKPNLGSAIMSDTKISNYTKMKADSFVKKISDLDSNNENVATELLNSEKKDFKPVFINTIIGQTHKKEFIELLNNYSNIRYDDNTQQSFLIYHDLSVTAYFDLEEKLEGLEFSELFNGATKKGLKIKDSVSKAVKLYGNPVSSDDDTISWKGIKITYNNSVVTSIYLKDNVETVFLEKNLLVSNFSVYTDGLLLGLILNNSTKSIILNGNDRKYVIDFMKDYSNLKISENEYQPRVSESRFGIANKRTTINYIDTGIIFYFDKNSMLIAFELRENFTGQTIKGLKIGDKLEKAVKLYGNESESDTCLSYKRMKICHDSDTINSILVYRENK